MRARIVASVSLAVVLCGQPGTAWADEEGVPSKADVTAAQERASDTARDVAAVRADLVRANLALEDAGIAAAQAAEAYNGAVWQAQQARETAKDAERAAGSARTEAERQRQVYAETVLTSLEGASGVESLSAMLEADGIDSLIERSVSMDNAASALDGQYDAFRAAVTIAEVAERSAETALAEAERLEAEAVEARDAAASAEAAAGDQAQDIARAKSDLIAELAELQGISIKLAEKRQAALEEAAAQAAAEAAAQQAAAEAAAQEAAAEAAAQQAAQEQAEQQAAEEQAEQQAAQEQASETPTQQPSATPTPTQTPTPTPTQAPSPTPSPSPTPAPTPTPTSTPTPTPTPSPAPAPAPSGGADAAIAFAKAQLGEPYRWGANGPDAWDCSGLTSGAWAEGGKYLPHYSVAQYTQSTAISASQLQPGDLVFWGSSSRSSSIYHVALYIGGGQIIHAPRTGQPVQQVSMYYWRAPNFFARP